MEKFCYLGVIDHYENDFSNCKTGIFLCNCSATKEIRYVTKT